MKGCSKMELTGNSLANRIIRSTLDNNQIAEAIKWVSENKKNKEVKDGNQEKV